jgi:tryptophan-rich sensory protein
MINIFKVNGRKNLKALIISVIISEGVGILSVICAGNIFGVFKELRKPSFAPSPWIFPIVWVVLYFLMAVAVYRIWILGQRGLNVKKALIFYAVQLILNFAWSIIFFKFKLIWLALIEILILLIYVILTAVEFRKFDSKAFILMIPYVAWVAFASVLTNAIWKIN